MTSSPERSWERIILHADMDAFYAAVEQLDHPHLRGKPLLIGHPGRRGVVSTASYEARPYGVGSAMPMVVAMRKCPHAVVVPPRMGRYVAVSREVMKVFRSYSPLVEPLSLDEAFLDLTGAERLFGSPREIARKLKDDVFEATGGLHVSVGVSGCKYVAKVASDHDKPDGLVVVPPDEMVSFLAPLPVKRLWGVGKKGQERLAQLGLETIADVANADEGFLQRELGELGAHIKRLSLARDSRPVIPEHDPKSLSSEMTLEHDVSGEAAIRPYLLQAAEIVARRLRAEGLQATGIRVKLKTNEFRLKTRQVRLARPADNADELFAAACELLQRFDLDEEFRLIGLGTYEFEEEGKPTQGTLFADPERERTSKLDQALDDLTSRFGTAAIRRAATLGGRTTSQPTKRDVRDDIPDE